MSSKFVQSINNHLRKFAVFAAAIMLAIGSIASPALAEEVEEPVIEDPVSPFSTDPEDIIASCAGSISNGGGTLECSMTSGNQYATIQVKSAANGEAGSIDCYVKFPNGNIYNLGSILASNGVSTPANFYFCPYGTYQFIFEASTNAELEVQGFIFD